MVIKCSMCNANITVEEGEKMVTCEFCGTVQMMPEMPGESATKRGYMYLEEGNWEKAKEHFDRALDENAEYSDAYLGKVLIATKVKTKQEFFDMDNIKNLDEVLRNIKYYPYYKNAIRFANDRMEANLEKFRENVYDIAYNKAKTHMEDKDYYSAIGWFKWIEEYKDTANLMVECEKALRFGVDEDIYQEALDYMGKKAYINAMALFEKLKGYQKSEELIVECKYLYAKEKMQAEDYMDAIELFKEIEGYEDSSALIERCEEIVTGRRYEYAMSHFENGTTVEGVNIAKEVFEKLAGYKDSENMIKMCDDKIADIVKSIQRKKKRDKLLNDIVIFVLSLVILAVIAALLM